MKSVARAESGDQGRPNRDSVLTVTIMTRSDGKKRSRGAAGDDQEHKKVARTVGYSGARSTRTGGRRTVSRNDEPANNGTDTTSKATRLPKRQVALMLGFCGTGCNGMQLCVRP